MDEFFKENEFIKEIDVDKQPIYCSFCGSQLVKMGHMFNEFMMCPKHGEFTIAPVVMRDTGSPTDETDMGDGRWYINLEDEQGKMMWETCELVDKDGLKAPHVG